MITNNKEESFVKGLSLMGFGRDGNSSVVDVKDGKMVRIRPLHYDWQYDKNNLNPWKMEVNGKVLEPLMKTLLPPSHWDTRSLSFHLTGFFTLSRESIGTRTTTGIPKTEEKAGMSEFHGTKQRIW